MTEPKKYNITDLSQTEHIYCPKTGELCHIVRKAVYDMEGYSRDDIVPVNEQLQVARVRADAGKVFQPHQHQDRYRTGYAHKGECWVVIAGQAEAHLYGIGKASESDTTFEDGPYLKSVTLKPGDILVTLRGGHGFRILQDGTLLIEVKGGPYEGVALDKKPIRPAGEPRFVSELWKHNDSFKDGADVAQNHVPELRRQEGQAGADVPGVLGDDSEREVQAAAAEVGVPAMRTPGEKQPEQ